MNAVTGRRSFTVGLVLLGLACGERKATSSELDAALSALTPAPGARAGLPARLRLDAAAGRFVAGAPPSSASSRSVMVGAPRLSFGTKRSDVSVTAAAGPGLALRPGSGPEEFGSWGPAISRGDALVYPSRDGRSAVVQRPVDRGLKEDIVLTRSLGDSLRFTWELELDEGLEARLETDGSVGIYGRHTNEDERWYRVPAPVIRRAGDTANVAIARFELNGSTLVLLASGLDAVGYPLSIDPSVVVTDFTQGNAEGGADLTASDRVTRSKTQFGNGPFSATASFTTARQDHTSVVSDGYLYVIGGSSDTGTLDDVQVARIDTNGSLSAFSATSSFTTPRQSHTSVAYHGYLYVIGGSSGSSTLNDVQVAPVNATNGTLGAFVATTSFPTPRQGHASVAYNGHLYISGGIDTGGTELADVQVAPINADGTLGAFVATTALPTARESHTSVAYDGHLYVIGGLDGSGSMNDVQVAPINANGTLGAFVATSSFALARHSHASVASNGYLYVLGGDLGAFLADVQAAPINANGTLGTFVSNAPLTSVRHSHASVAFNGYLYVTGGSDGGRTNGVQVAPLDVNGALRGFSATTALPTARYGHASVMASNGYVYVSGGTDSSGYLSEVRGAPASPDGKLGAFSITASFTTARTGHTSLAANGYLYVIGGFNGSYLNDVRKAPINANGTLGSFTATSSFTTPRAGHTSVAANGFLYVIGGSNGGSLADVQRATINADGSLGTFAATSSFVTARHRHSSLAYGGYLYVLGGTDGAQLNDVQVASINADGTLSAFSLTTSFPTPRESHTSVASNGYLYVLGGRGAGNLSDVQVAPINANGTLGAFSATSSFPTARHDHTSVASDGYLYVLGGDGSGDGSGFLGDVQVAPLNATHGGLGAFVSPVTFPTARYGHAAVTWNGFVYVVGGRSTNYLSDVRVAPINANGTLGAFANTTPIPGARQDHASVAHNGYLYVIGGRNNADLADVRVAPINANGTLGAFATTTSLPAPRYNHNSVVSGGSLYVIGGNDSSFNRLNDVLVAAINANGTLGPFVATTSFATARQSHTSVGYGGHLYVIGGESGPSSLSATSDVQVAPINANGTLGAFTHTTSLPTGRWNHASVAHNGFLYVIGGYGGAVGLSDVQVAAIHSNGRLGPFFPTTSLPTARDNHAAVVAGGVLYVLGGNSTSSALNDVQMATLQSPVARGHYSRLVDLGAASSLVSLTVNGSPRQGVVQLEHRLASAAGVFGPTTSLGPIPLGVALPLAANDVRYLFVRFTLDDTRAAAINPDAVNERDVTDFTVLYNPALVLSPLAATLPPRGSQAFTCSGGSDAGLTFEVNPNNSGGTITPAGLYTAGADGGVSDTVTCTDAIVRLSAPVTVTAGLTISPATSSVAPREAVAFSATGGSGTAYSWTLATNGSAATLSPTGGYTAGSTGSTTDTVRVTDSLGNLAERLVTVRVGVSITPAAVAVPPRGSSAFSAAGGSDAGFVWSFVVNASGGAIAGSGSYTAGSTPNVTDSIRVTDSLGNTATALANVGPALSVAPLVVTLPPRGTQVFAPDGGSGVGLTWSLSTSASGGSITSAGVYTAGSTGNVSDVIQLVDSVGNTATAAANIGPGVSIAPSMVSLPPRGVQLFVAAGGSAGYVWSFQQNASGGAVDGGLYVAGATGSVTDVVRALDSLGNEHTATIDVGPEVALSPLAPFTAPLGVITFSVTGGAGAGFVWSVATDGGSSISPAGEYRAGPTEGVDSVSVVDALGNFASTQVTVTTALRLTPGTTSLRPRESQTFSATGGSDGGRTWAVSLNNSGGLVTSQGVYTAGAVGDVMDQVQVTDSLGVTASADITVGPAVSIAPSSASVPPGGSQPFSATGGTGSYTWSVANVSGGRIDSVTGAYTAGREGNVTDVVRATDPLGNTATVDVVVTEGVTISPAAPRVAPTEAVAFTATGGSGTGYRWALTARASEGTIDPMTGAYQAGPGEGTDAVEVTDSLGNIGRTSVSVVTGTTVTPFRERPPVGGWSCGCGAGGLDAGWLLGLLLLARRNRRAASSVSRPGRRVGALSMAALALALAGPAEAKPAKAAEPEAAAKKLIARREYERAIKWLDFLLKKASPPELVRYQLLRGAALAGAGQHDAAIEAFADAVARDATAQLEPQGAPPGALALFEKGRARVIRPPPPQDPKPEVAPAPAPAPAAVAPAALVVAEAPRKAERPSVAVLDVEVTVPGEKLDATAFSEMLTSSIDGSGMFRVVSAKEIATMLGLERQRQLLGCTEDSSCMAEIANALGADLVLVGSIGRVGDTYLVTVKMIDGRKSRTAARASAQATDANALLVSLWNASQEVLEKYGAQLEPAQAKAWASRPAQQPPASVAATERGVPIYFGAMAGVVGGLQVLSEPGRVGSIAIGVDVTFRRKRLDLAAGILIGPNVGARLTATWALIDARFRLCAGLRATAYPGQSVGLYGGGIVAVAEFALLPALALHASGSGEIFGPAPDPLVIALFGTLGVALRF